jgi:hypothetical protein
MVYIYNNTFKGRETMRKYLAHTFLVFIIVFSFSQISDHAQLKATFQESFSLDYIQLDNLNPHDGNDKYSFVFYFIFNLILVSALSKIALIFHDNNRQTRKFIIFNPIFYQSNYVDVSPLNNCK